MPDTKISALSAAAALGPTDILPAVQGGLGPFGLTGAQIAEYIRDTIGTALVAGMSTSITVNDAGDTITIAASPPFPAYIAGNYYLPPGVTVGAGTAPPVNTIRCVPFQIFQPVTIQAIGTRITTLSASGNVQFAIYANNAATGRPTGTALGATGSLSTTLTGVFSAAPAGGNFTLQPGTYWSAVNQDNSTAAYRTNATGQSFTTALIGTATEASITNASTSAALTISTAQTFGTWPDLTGASFTETTALGSAMIHFRAA